MESHYLQQGQKAKISIKSDIFDIQTEGIIDKIEGRVIEIIIEGTYIQNSTKTALCHIIGDATDYRFEGKILDARGTRLFILCPDQQAFGILEKT